MTIRHIASDRAAPPPISARYSHAVEAGGLLFVTGQLPVDPQAPSAPLPDGIAAQADLVFRNLKLIAEDAGYELSDTVFVRVYLLDFDRDYVAFNSVYSACFPDTLPPPGRTTVGVARLGRGALVEVDLVMSHKS